MNDITENTLDWKDFASVENIAPSLHQTTEWIVFKHSPRCPISRFALKRFTEGFDLTEFNLFMVNVLTQRDISNQLAEDFNIKHESPQVIIQRKDGKIISLSHEMITMENIHQLLEA